MKNEYIKTHQNHIAAASKILKHMNVPEKNYGGGEWAEQGGILKSEFYTPSNKTKIVLHTRGDKHHISVENVLKKSNYHSYDTEDKNDKDKTETLYSTTSNKPEFSWDHISDEYFSHASDMHKWGNFSSEFSKAKTAVEKNEKSRKNEMTNINEGLSILVKDRRTGKPVYSDHVGDVIDNRGNEHYESPMDYHKKLSDYATKNPHHEVTVTNDFGQKQTIMPRKRLFGLRETHNLPAFSDAAQNDKRITDLLKKHGKLTTDDDSYLTDHYHKQYYIQHPNNKNHTLMVHHTIDTNGKQSQMVNGVRYSEKTDKLLGFIHTNGDKQIKTNHEYTDDDAFDDNFHHLKRYLENDWKKVGTMNESMVPSPRMSGKPESEWTSQDHKNRVIDIYRNWGQGVMGPNQRKEITHHEAQAAAKKVMERGKHHPYMESYNLVENTKKVLPDNLMAGYAKFISKQNSYNNLGVVDEGIKDFFKTHEPDGTESYDTDPHETEAAFGYTLNRFREAGGNKWDLHIKGSHGRRIAGEKVTPFGKHIMRAKPIPHKTTGTLLGSFVHKENPEHRIDFALGRDGKGGTKILNAHHNMSGSSISNASIGDMEQFMGKLTRTAKGYQGLTEGLFGSHKSEKVHEKGLAALLKNGFKLDPTAEKYNARAGKYLHFSQTGHHYLVHPNGKHKVAYNASSSPDYHSISVYDGDVEDDNHLFTGNFKTPERMIEGLKYLKECYQGLNEGVFGPHKSEKVHEKGLEALLRNGFTLDPKSTKQNARAGKYLHFGQTSHHYLVHPNGKHKLAYNASSEPDYHSVTLYDGDTDGDHLFTGNFNTPERMIQGLKYLKEDLSLQSHIQTLRGEKNKA